MAATYIPINDQKQLGRRHCRGMEQVREGYDTLVESLATMATMVDGDGSQAAHFEAAVTEGTYSTTAAAKASWDELQSMKFVVGQAEAAFRQCCAKHGR